MNRLLLVLLSVLLASVASAQKWTRITTNTSPPPMAYHAMAFDAARSEIVLFGTDGSTWTFDGTDWSQESPALSPPTRSEAAMCYDSARQVVVLFGGNILDANVWEWDGSTWSVRFVTNAPPARRFPGLAYDFRRQKIVLFGGLEVGTGRRLGDTWELTGSSWLKIQTANSPSARYWHGMAYDPVHGEVVMANGQSTGITDCWIYDGTDWTHSADSPAGGNENRAVYDPSRQKIILTATASNTYVRVAEWNGESWLPRLNSYEVRGFALASDDAGGRIVRFGGSSGTYIYDLPVRGSQTPIGVGCGGTGGPPSLVAEGAVAIGNLDFELVVTNGYPMSTAMVALSAVQTALPLGPCMLYPLPLVVWMTPSMTSSSGEARFPIPIPFSVVLAGANITCQGFVIDPQGGFLGFAFTPGLQLVIGS